MRAARKRGTLALPTQQIFSGRFEAAHRAAVSQLENAGAMRKVWAKDASLWRADSGHAKIIANRLGWIGVLDKMRQESGELQEVARKIRNSGVRNIVLLGMGGSSLAPEVFALTFAPPGAGCRFFVLDSTDPPLIFARSFSSLPASRERRSKRFRSFSIFTTASRLPGSAWTARILSLSPIPALTWRNSQRNTAFSGPS